MKVEMGVIGLLPPACVGFVVKRGGGGQLGGGAGAWELEPQERWLAPDWVWGGAAAGLEEVRELPGLCRRVRSRGDWPGGGS